jgi:hypothetical protein
MPARGTLAAFALLLALAMPALGAADATDGSRPAATRYEFAALGDAPYSNDEEEQLIAMLAEMNRGKLAFAVHVGDFKRSTTVCADELYLQRRDWFRLSHHPFVYVPGDNDWSDCWRPFGAGREPLERLARLREIFFQDDYSLGQDQLELTRQLAMSGLPGARYPEHARWTYGRVLYVTLNVPGGNNNRVRMPEEAARRNVAVGEWVRDAYAVARELKFPAIVFFMQADPWRPNGQPRPAYAALLQQFATESGAFPGEVLLVHGDTHRFRVDRPLVNPATWRPVPNFMRLEVYGSPVVNWVRVTVTVQGDAARFDVRPGTDFSAPRYEPR